MIFYDVKEGEGCQRARGDCFAKKSSQALKFKSMRRLKHHCTILVVMINIFPIHKFKIIIPTR
jgi:hypothetical protein